MNDAAFYVATATRGWSHLWPGSAKLSATELAGGLSDAPPWKIEANNSRWVLRAWPVEQRRQAALVHRLLENLQAARPDWVPVPLPISSGAATLLEGQGTLWELAPWLPSEASFASEPTLSKLTAACRALAEFHRLANKVPLETASSASYHSSVYQSSVDRHASRLQQLDQQLARRFASVDSSQRELLHAGGRLALGGLAPLVKQPQASQGLPAQLCWGDAWHSNFLFQGDEVSGLVDFATVRIDTRAADLARLLGSATEGKGDWRLAGLEAYEEVAPLQPSERQAVDALEASGAVLSLANWVEWLVVEKRSFRYPPQAWGRCHHFAKRVERLLKR